MIGLMIVVVLVVLAALTLFLIAPTFSRRGKSWRGTPFAHRGLYGNGIAENTLEGFAHACETGFGIELDVQFSRDGAVVVFHDDDLKRMTGDPRRVDEVDLAELQGFALAGGAGHIPTFKDVLACVDGRVPLVVELKNGRRNDKLCEDTMALLRAYKGPYVVESFNPGIVAWMRKHAPDVIRGQLVDAKASYLKAKDSPWKAFKLSSLLYNFLTRPDFVAYNVAAEDFPAPGIQRALFHTLMAAWTVRDPATYKALKARGEMPIFEGFVPDEH